MQKTNFKRLLCFLTALSMVMSMVILPAAAEEGSEHICEYTQETILANPTCNVAGSKKLSCTCGEYIEEGIPATNQHTYEQGVCSVCGAEKICTGTADCDAPTHVSCLSQCNLHVSCPSNVHKEGCLKDQACTCVQACSENMACPVCQDGGVCTGGAAAENIARVQALIDALPASYNLSQAEQMKAQYDACTAQIAALPEYQRAALTLTKYNAAATPTVIDDVHSIFVGNTGYSSLEEAIAEANETDVIKLKANTNTDTYKLPATLTKNLKIQALDRVEAKDVIIDLGKTSNTTSAKNIEVSFTGVTLKRPDDSTAQGFLGMASETYTNCIIAGPYWAFAKTADFTGCTFETTSTANYNVHTHLAESVSFNNCTFACAGKSVKIYNEGTNGTNATFTGCKFTAEPSVAGTAIEIDSSKLATQTKNKIFSVSISRGNDTVTGFVKNDTVTNTLWTNKGDLTEVTINGGKALTIKPTADTLPVLVNVKDEIILQNNVTLTESLTISKPLTLNLNGKTITNAVESGSLFLVTDALTIRGTAAGSSIVNDENSTGILLTNNGKEVTISSGSFDGKVISNGENAVTSISGGTYANFAAEMTEGGLVVIAGGTFKTGDTVTDVSNYTYPGYTQDPVTGKVSKADIPSTGSKVVSAVEVNSQTVDEAVISITANTAPESVDTGLNALFSQTNLNKQLLDALKANPDNNGKTYYGTTLRTTVKVTLTQVQTNADENKVTRLAFTAEPQIQAIDKDGAVIASAPISIEDNNKKTFTFRLPIVGSSKLVNLDHNGKTMGTYSVQDSDNYRYIEIKTTSFSPWTVTLLDEEAKIVATVNSVVAFADIDSALSYLQENGGKLELRENVTTASSLTLPAEKSAEVILSDNSNTYTYTYTGNGAAFENNATKLVLSDGIVKATNGGTLVKSNTGTLEISGISFTSTTGSGETTVSSRTGNTIDIIDGTATISSGNRFSGNALSLRVSPDKEGSATIYGSTFNKGVEGNITIHDGTFNGNVEGKVNIYGGTFKQNVETSETIPGTIPGTSKLNTAVFHIEPDAEIESHYQIVETKNGDNTVYVIAENPHVIVTIGTNDPSKLYYNDNNDIKNLDDVIEKTSNLVSVKLTRDEVINENHTLSGNQETIIEFAGYKITGSGSLTTVSKSLFLKDAGNKLVTVELGAGDKAAFNTNGTILVTAAENKNGNTSYGYGEVDLTLKVDNKSVSSVYFLGTDATLKIGTNGSISTTGQVITQLTADANGKPTYLIHTVSDGTDLTNNFVMKSSDKLVFTSNGFYEGFSKVTVNGKDLSTSNYTKEKGSTIITLKNTYLKTLTKGKYELKIHYKDGKTAAANFYVVEAAKATTTPKTGDPIMSAVFGMNASAAALGALLFLGKKKKK